MTKKKSGIKKSTSKRGKDGRIFRITIFAVTLFLVILLLQQRVYLHRFYSLGYIGVFLVNFIASATVLLPLPGVASVFIGGAIWNPLLIGLFSSVGATFGEVFGYFLGYGGRGFLRSFEKSNHWMVRVEIFFHRAGFLTIFVFSLLPIPIFDIIGIMAGVFNYPIWKFAAATFLGRFLRNFIIAWSGAKLLL